MKFMSTSTTNPSIQFRKILQHTFLLTAIVLTSSFCLILIVQLPIFQNLPYWFWPLQTLENPQYGWIIPILMLNFGLLAIVWKFPDKVIRNLVLLILLGFATQQMFALIDGRSLEGMRDRVVSTGHADFAYDAVNPPSITRVMRDYRSITNEQGIHRYPHSTKPPGHFLVYITSSRIAHLLPWLGTNPFQRLTTFLALFFPLLTYLPVIPLFFLARLYLSHQQAYLVSLLFISAPNINLMTLHLDQSLYPLLFFLPLTLYLYGRKSGKVYLFLLSGLAIAAAVLVSFSLIPVIAIIGFLSVFSLFGKKEPFASRIAVEFKAGALIVVGFLVFELILFALFRYNLLSDYLYVMSQHQAWKISEWTAPLVMYIGALDILEFAIWTGVPLFLFSAAWMIKSLRNWKQANSHLALSMLICILLLAFFGKTVAETGRLWIFLVPCLALFALQDLIDRYPDSYKRVFVLILGMQLLSTFVIKLFQDFY